MPPQHLLQAHLPHHHAADLLEEPQLLLGALQCAASPDPWPSAQLHYALVLQSRVRSSYTLEIIPYDPASIPEGLTFDDVLLVPARSAVLLRGDGTPGPG